MKPRHLKFTTGILTDSDAKNSQKYTGSWVKGPEVLALKKGDLFDLLRSPWKRFPCWTCSCLQQTLEPTDLNQAKSQLTSRSVPMFSRELVKGLNVRFHKITNDSSDPRNVPWVFPKKWQLEKLSWGKSYWAKCLHSICSQWRCYLSNMCKIIQSLSHVQTTYHIYMKHHETIYDICRCLKPAQ